MTTSKSGRIMAGLAAFALGALVAGCGSDQTAVRAKKRPRVALIMKSLANEFFQTMEEGAKAHQKKCADDYDLLTNGIKDERDAGKQIDLVHQMIAQGVDAIVIAPADSKALVPVCKEALDKGIVVVNIDNRFDEDALKAEKVEIPFVGPNNMVGARMAGDYLAKQLKPGDKVVIVEGIPTANNALMRRLGFEAAMHDAKVQIVAKQSGEWETDKAQKVVANLVVAHPDIKAVLCANDSMALGAVTALEEAGKLKDVLVVGYDNISPVQRLIKEGKVLCTVDQHADRIAVNGIVHALDILEKKIEKKKDETLDKQTPVDLITAASLK